MPDDGDSNPLTTGVAGPPGLTSSQLLVKSLVQGGLGGLGSEWSRQWNALAPVTGEQAARMGTTLGLGFAGSTIGFYGTPYTFEPTEGNPFGEFKNEAIGTGEGSQAYGWGHYVAGNQAVAQEYARKLSNPDNGNLLEIQIKPDKNELLDWDKPWGQQTLAVQEGLLRANPGLNKSLADERNPTGEDLYRGLSGWNQIQEEASQALHASGIPGIKYLDAGSREAGVGTHNYVIFHPSNLTITARNGQRLEPVPHDPFTTSVEPVEGDPFAPDQDVK